MTVHATLHKRLREALDASDLNLKTIAHRAGYSSGYITSLAPRSKHMQPRNPTIGAVWAIAGALGVDPLWLLGA